MKFAVKAAAAAIGLALSVHAYAATEQVGSSKFYSLIASDEGDTGTDAGDTGTDAGDTGTDAGDTGTDEGDTGTDEGDGDGKPSHITVPTHPGHSGYTPPVNTSPGGHLTLNKPTVESNQSAIIDVANQQAHNTDQIFRNTNDIATNKADIATNAGHIATNTSDIATNRQSINDLNSAFTGYVADANHRMDDMQAKIDKNHKKANAGTSTALAVAGIPQVMGDQKFAVGAGVGGYEDQAALAVGVSARVTDSVTLKAAVGTDTQHGVGYNVGASWGW